MKPKDLKPFFLWEDRHVIIKDRVWHIPIYYDKYETFTFPGWESKEVFGNTNPVCVEYCSGNGTWIAQKAVETPEKNWVAIEMDFERVRKIWSKIQNLKIKNLLVVYAEAYQATQLYFPSDSVESIYINFPDPWPKKRHIKKRLIKPIFLNELYRVLKEQGTVTFVTDDETYSNSTIETFDGVEGFASAYQEPYYRTDISGYGNSFFDTLWRGKGKEIRHHLFTKVEESK